MSAAEQVATRTRSCRCLRACSKAYKRAWMAHLRKICAAPEPISISHTGSLSLLPARYLPSMHASSTPARVEQQPPEIMKIW
jgi:hypothetical protein